VSNPQRGHLICSRVLQLLTAEREKRGVSKYALSQKSGVSPQMIGYIEKGERNPTLEVVCRLADALGIELATLMRQAEREVPKDKAR
jgi:transcriptional regulator with XRE-family HTH domain